MQQRACPQGPCSPGREALASLLADRDLPARGWRTWSGPVVLSVLSLGHRAGLGRVLPLSCLPVSAPIALRTGLLKLPALLGSDKSLPDWEVISTSRRVSHLLVKVV